MSSYSGSEGGPVAPATPVGKAEKGDKATNSLTARELEILAKVWTCLKSGAPDVTIDFDKLAAELGLTNPRSASNAWSRIKAKLWGDAPNTPLTAAKPKKRAAGGDDDAAAADAAAADGNDTPAKKPKATPKPRGPRKKNVKSAPVAPKPEDEEEKSEVAKVEDAFMGEA